MPDLKGENLPYQWKLKNISDLCEFIVDCIHETPELSDSFTGYFMIRTSDVGNGHISLENARYVSKEVYNFRISRGMPQRGDIVISREAPLGNVGQILVNENICLGQRLIHYRPNREVIDSRYLLFALLSPTVQQEFRANGGTGSIVDNLRMQAARDLSIPVPPLPEQRAIAGVLGALDDKIELNRRMNSTLEEIAKTLYKHWFVNNDDSKSWETGTLSNIAYFVKGVSYRSNELVDMSNAALVTLKCMERGGGYKEEGLKPFVGEYKPAQRVFPGEIVVAHTDLTQAADVVGRAARVESNEKYPFLIASLDMVIVRPKERPYSSEYLYCVLSQGDFADHAYGYTNGTTVLHLSSKGLPEFPIRIPPKEKVEEFTEIVSSIYAEIDNNKTQSRLLASLRDSLLPKLMSGEVRIKKVGEPK